jgi:hypothetical protein
MSESIRFWVGVLAMALLVISCDSSPWVMDPAMDPGTGGLALDTGGAGGTSTSHLAPLTGGSAGSSIVLAPAGTGGISGASFSGTNNEECVGSSVSWQTPTVRFEAKSFWIKANGLCFSGSGGAVYVHSDPGDAQYTTLELVWTEHEREMRLFIYFNADASGWWSGEMRTYNGLSGFNADWISYTGAFFKTPIGKTFVGDLDLTSKSEDMPHGRLHLGGLTLSTSLSGS